jgi:hypothetical protein
MFKMGSHDPFGFLKHKLWPKERLGISPIKSWESAPFPCVQVTCHIPLKSSSWGLQLCFRPHFNRRSANKVIGVQSGMSSNFGNFGTPTWGPRQNDFWVLAPWPGTKNTVRGKVVASPKSRPWWILWVHVWPWFVHAPKCFNYVITNLLFG